MSDISKQYASSLEEDAHWLTEYAQGKKDCQRLIEITTTMYRAAWALGKLPSAQPEIIRCKDCKNWDTTWQNDWAKNYHYCPLVDGTRNGDWYCADAERRNDD